MLASIRVGFFLQNGLPHTKYGLACPPVWLFGGRRPVQIIRLAQSLH